MSSEWFKKKLQTSIERIFRHRVYCFMHRKHGHQGYADMKYSGQKIHTIFDVGANTGQSAEEYSVTFPGASVSCFEPVSSTYAELEGNVRSMGHVNCHNLALGSEPGESTIYISDISTANSLINHGSGDRKETIQVSTVDIFAKENNVDKIDFLKIDTEGFDIEVLKGAEGMLSSGSVSFVQVEVSFNREGQKHVLFDDVRDLLAGHGFVVFGFYEQHLEWSGEQSLRFANALFYRKPSA